MIIAFLSLCIYSYSLWIVLSNKKEFSYAQAGFYVALISLVISDVNVGRYNLDGFNFYTHALIMLYCLFFLYKYHRVKYLIKNELHSLEPTLISWNMLKEGPDKANLNNNKITTERKVNKPYKMIYVSKVSEHTVVDNYINDFRKKLTIKHGSCVIKIEEQDKSISVHSLTSGNSIEIEPNQEHWFFTEGEICIIETICVK